MGKNVLLWKKVLQSGGRFNTYSSYPVNVKKRTTKKEQGVRKMTCGYLLDMIVPFVQRGGMMETTEMVKLYFQCVMLA